jgi:transketolase
MNTKKRNFFKKKSFWLRKSILMSAKQSGGRGSHLGGTMSCVDILNYLYFDKIIKFNSKKPKWPMRDRVLIGKGHAHLALYHIWSSLGFFNKKKISEYGKNGASLGVQLDISTPGSEYNTGSLGHVIGIGVGIGLKSKIDKNKFKIYCLVGDGECESGSIWESVLSASRLKINNLVVIVDMNRLSEFQILDSKSDLELKKKFKSYNWNVEIVNGHSFDDMEKVFKKKHHNNFPTAIIANTIKGKGVSFMENNVDWHHKAPNPQEFRKALSEYE